MRQKLLALAVLSATTLMASSAMAQSANPVTLYGTMRIALESVKATGGSLTNMPNRTRVEDQNTLFGIRGTETISPELTAFFQLEQQVNLDVGTGTLASRNSAMGLRGNWGSIQLGRWDTPLKIATTNLSPFSDIQMSGIQSVMNDAGNFHLRPNNSLIYVTPTWSGFTARLQYAANEGKTTTADPTLYGLSAIYDVAPIQIGYAYEEHKDRTGSETTVTAGYKEESSSIFGKYTIGPFWISLLAQEFKKTNLTKQKATMVALNYTVDNSQFKLMYSKSKDGAASTAAVPESSGLGLGWYYALSKRTTFTMIYSAITNNAATNRAGFAKTALTRCAGTTVANCVGNDGDPSGFSVGFLHTF